jgi:hypothetical protein
VRIKNFLLTFFKAWQNLIASKYDQMFDPNSSLFQGQFNGNPIIKDYLMENLKKMESLETSLKANPAAWADLEAKKAAFKQKFIENIKIDTTSHLCDCQLLFARGIFPNGLAMVKQQCATLCGVSTTLEFDDEDYDLGFDE